MHASPPETTANRTDVAAATAPASTSPSRGPDVTTAMCSALSRPRISSGATSWRIVFRKTAEMTSAQPGRGQQDECEREPVVRDEPERDDRRSPRRRPRR